MSKKFNFYPYSWHYNDEIVNNSPQCVIRIFGWNEKNESMCVKCIDFEIPVWIELPQTEEWTANKKLVVANYFKNMNKYPTYRPKLIKYIESYIKEHSSLDVSIAINNNESGKLSINYESFEDLYSIIEKIF